MSAVSKRDIVDRIRLARTEPTRDRRIEEALNGLSEGANREA
jgi:hypothetical protein